MRDWLIDLGIQVRNASPVGVAVILDANGSISLDKVGTLAVIVYTVLQAGFLVWKWNKAREDRRNGKSET